MTLANGSKQMATTVGSAQPLPFTLLESVLYVPKCAFNLVSVSRLTRTLKCSVTFDDDFVFIQDRSTGQVIGAGRESQGMYYLSSPSVACTTASSPDLHHCLGRPSLSKLKKMVLSLSSLSCLNCESCQLGKQSRVSFPKCVVNRVASPFALVHSDIWGPSRIFSISRYQYFLTFIDDYSRGTWLYLMKSQSEVLSIFETFCAKTKNQFRTNIQVLRSDNVLEYFSINFLSSHGIIHQSSCAYAPDQQMEFQNARIGTNSHSFTPS